MSQLLRFPRIAKGHRCRRLDLTGCPQKRGTCLIVRTMTPRKPNSAIRKIARSLFSNRKTASIYIRGEGHNLQKHSRTLNSGGRTKDLPGLKYKAIRGKLDFHRLEERRTNRSLYAVKLPADTNTRGIYHKAKLY